MYCGEPKTGLRKNPKAFDVKPADTMEQERYTLMSMLQIIHGENTKEALIEANRPKVLYRLYLLGLKHGMFTRVQDLEDDP